MGGGVGVGSTGTVGPAQLVSMTRKNKSRIISVKLPQRVPWLWGRYWCRRWYCIVCGRRVSRTSKEAHEKKKSHDTHTNIVSGWNCAYKT